MKIFIIFLFLLFSLKAIDLEKPQRYVNQDIKGWYMSEKLDGIRAYWTGKKFITRNGNTIHAPKEFSKNFPSFSLDGELWTKRADFENIQSIVLDKKPSIKWSEITYNIFEAPDSKGNFKERLKRVKVWFLLHENKNIRMIEQIKCMDKSHLYSHLNKILQLKGEGLIIKNPNLPYIGKRSKNSLKVMIFNDQEGIVQNINYNKNNKMRSLVLLLDTGVVFNLGGGFTKEQRENPPKVGDIVNFKYYGLTKNKKPKFASFLRVRFKE